MLEHRTSRYMAAIAVGPASCRLTRWRLKSEPRLSLLPAAGFLVGLDQFGKDPLQDSHITVGQWRREVALDPLQMSWPHPLEDRSALVADGDVELPTILTTQGSFDEAIPFHPVQESREPASTQLVARDH